LARPETGAAFFVTPSDSGRQRPRHAASPPAKPRKVKDYSDDAGKPELRRTAWWWPQSPGRGLGIMAQKTGNFLHFLVKKQAFGELAAAAFSISIDISAD
jgi:hypothetical protein